jgi:glucose/arabinose dehydrogenase
LACCNVYKDYDDTIISKEQQKKAFKILSTTWAPSIAPSGMAFVTSTIYPKWKGNLLVGSLKFQYVEMLTLPETKLQTKIATDVGVCVILCKVLMGTFMGVEGKRNSKIIPN